MDPRNPAPVDLVLEFAELPPSLTAATILAAGVELLNLDSPQPTLVSCGLTFTGNYVHVIGSTLVVRAAEGSDKTHVIALTSRRIVFRPTSVATIPSTKG
jgi:hypothetical protein